MERSTAQNSLPGLPHGVPQDSLPQEYWDNLGALYPNQLQAPSQQQNPSESLGGIGWDHPVFHHQSRQQLPSQSSQRNELPPQTEQNHGIYSFPPSWQPNPLQQPGRSYGVQSPYPPRQVQQSQQPQQVPQYQQDPLRFDSRPLNPSETSAFPQYSYQPPYFPHQQQLPAEGSFQDRSGQQHLPPDYQPPQSVLPQFELPSTFPTDLLDDNIDLTDDFPSAPAQTSTIDPSFLNPGLQAQSQQPPHLQNAYNMFSTSVGIPQQGGQAFDYYQNGITLQPSANNLNHPGIQLEGHNHTKPSGLPMSQVVINTKKASAKKSQSKKTSTKAKKSKTTQESDSSDGSESDIEAPPEPSPIPPQRPTDRMEAAAYDTMQAVWAPRNKRVAPEKVKSALVAYKDLVKTLRDSWKDQVNAMKLAENSGDNAKANALKQDVTLQRGVMDRILETTIGVGHPVIVEKLGEHPVALSAINSFIVDRFQATDFDGSLTTNILKVLGRFITVDEEMLQKTNLAKVLPRFVKRGGPLVKELAQKILDNAKASTKRKQTSKSNEDSPSKVSARNSPSVDAAGLKRSREGENSAQPTKRLVVTSNPKDQGKPTAVTNGPMKRAPDGAPNGKTAASATSRPKPNHVTPKPSSLFGALSSASKRPGTTNAERAAAAAAAKANPAPEKKEKAAPPKPAFSFGDLMADLSKPKETVVAKLDEDQPPETEEERAKRLRKEERRKLRVTWKPEESLTEVRLFTHDPEEELNPEDGSFNDVGANVKSEGDALRLHKDKEVEAEDDDFGGGIREISLYEDYTLSLIDIDLEAKSSNYIKRGGNKEPESPEKEAQDHHEATTLMVFYSSPADVPSTPKEPPPVDEDEVVPDVVPFGELPDNVKAKEEQYYARINPKPVTQPQPQLQPQAQANAGNGGFDISNLLKLMQTGTQQQSTPPPQPVQQVSQPPMSDLERTISMFRQQQGAQVPQAPVPPAAAPVDLQGILNVMKQFQPGGLNQPPQTQPVMAPNLGAVFGQFSGQATPGGTSQGQQPNGLEDPERKRMREGGNSHYDSHYDNQSNDQWSRGKRTKANAPQPYKVGLVACKFWADGKCRKGENCTFRHDD